MKKANLNKLLIFGTLLLVSVAQSWANSYYAKMIAKVSTGGSTGKGTVYVSDRNNSSSTSYGSTSEVTIETSSSGGNCTFYLFAQPSDGYELAWWSTTDEGGNDGGVATNGAITVKASTNEDGTIEYTRYAVFKALPTFYFSATANVGSAGGGTASVTPTTTSAYGQHWNSESANATATFTATPNSGYEFYGWSNTADGTTIVSSNNPYNAAITSNSQNSASPTNTTLYAVFKPLSTFYFSATASVSPIGAGAATATLNETSKYGEHWNSESAATTATYSVTSTTTGYKFIGWSETTDGAIVSEEQTYSKSVTSTSTNSGAPTNSTMYARFIPDPTGINVAPSSMVLGVGETGTISVTLEPNPSYRNVKFTSTSTSIASVTAEGIVTGVSVGETTITVQAVKIDNSEPESLRKTVTVTVKAKCATPTISFSDVTVDGAKATLSSATTGATIYYTINGSEPTASSTPYTTPFTVEPDDVVRAIAIVTGTDGTYWMPSDVLIKTYKTSKVATPSIVVGGDGTISFTCSEEGTITYKYCISDDGDCTPTTAWNGTPIAKNLANNEKIIKVIASKDGCIDSDPATKQYTASGISGTTVILNDYEDHTWTYYAGVPADVDGGNYNTNYAGKIYSPDPRNVKITYQANGGAVSIDEEETEFVYYKTIEKVGGTYKYQVISNPFSKRPTGKGFGGWEVVSGGSYIGKTNGAVLALDEELTLTGLDNNYTANCTSAEIVLQATWVDANVTTITSNPTSNQTYSFTGGTYETNFIVLKNVNYTRTMTINSPCTIMMVEPDGSADYRSSYTFSGNITPNNTGVTKIENAKWNPSGNIAAGGKSLWIGRGVTTVTNTSRSVTLANGGSVNQIVKIESGTFGTLTHYNSTPSSLTKQILVLGNDYDRAKNDNTKLTFTGRFEVNRCDGGSNYAQEACRVYSKSGSFMTSTSIESASRDYSYYLSYYSGTSPERSRYFEIEGGEWYANISGGQDNSTTANNYTAFTFRMRGGIVRGSIYGSAQQYNSHGNRILIFTGGQIGGWVAGAANGTSSNNGVLYGSTYVYFGGNAKIATQYQNRTNASSTKINNSIGGNVFASGCGNGAGSNSGSVSVSSNGVIADNAEIEYGAYGGGAFGKSTNTANVYITGGHVKSLYDSQSTSFGGVYGGARQNDGGTVNMYMTGGQIDGVTNSGTQGGGLFGGSNASGTIDNNVTIVVTGGQVGTSTNNANIHGGGYGASTTVSQNVDVTLGTRNTTTGETAGTAVVYGDVYGGSALGNVNGTSATTTYKTNVTLNAGTINGSLYGGALGNNSTAANVYGPVAVKVYGGSVLTTDGTGANGSGAVYGANNVNGAPQRAVTVDIYGTDEAPEEGEYALFAVYGGGNQAAYTYTETGKIYPQVTIHNCENSIEYVYGGGNQAAVPGTQVKVYGGNVIGHVFGGGNKADVTTNGTDVDIYGGTILNVFGGNNNGGSVTGNINVNVNAQAENSGTACTMAVGNVYGGGNIASYTGSPVVDFLNGTSTGSVFGGGKGKDAVVVGNPTVNIGDWDDDHSAYIGGSVFGGGDLAAVEGNPIVVIRDCGTTICGDLYGGGNAAPVYSTNTTMWGGTVKGNVFGGGNGSDATKNPNGAQVGYKRDDATAGTGDGNAVTNIYGGTIGTWTTVSGVETCTAGGGVFGGSNTNGNIRGAVQFKMDEQACTETGAEQCDLKVKEAYGAGNEAAYKGTGITFALGCITSQNEIYGGAKAADLKGDVNLRITNGHFDKVFGGNNISGKLEGKIVVTVDETGCKPVTIGALYGGGNQAAYSVYGYGTDGSVNTSGSDPYADPVVNIVSCTRIDTIFGGGLGSTAVMVGNPKITVQQVAGKYDPDDDDASDGYSTNTGKLGAIGTIFGGGNEAEVKGTPEIRIATEDAILRADGTTSLSRESANITGNIYGGGNKAKVTGNTKVVIGPQKATVTP